MTEQKKTLINPKIVLPVLGVVLLLVLILKIILTSTGVINKTTRLGYIGPKPTTHQWKGVYYMIDGRFSNSMKPSAGSDTMTGTIKTKSGNMTITVSDGKDTLLNQTITFDEGSEEDNEYRFQLHSTNTLKVTIKADKHEGSFDITY